MSTTIEHKDKTLQDLYDEFTPSQKELVDLIVGAAVEDEDLSGQTDVISDFNALSDIQKDLVDFIVGSATFREETLEHSADLAMEDFLAHFGVKGMRWGVRKKDDGGGSSGGSAKTAKTAKKSRTSGDIDGGARLSKSMDNTDLARRAAREKVRVGTATMKEAHIASLKSTGHRTVNALLGDKTFWKRAAQYSVAGLAIGGAITAVPLVLPSSTLAAIGMWTVGAAASSSGASAGWAAASITTAQAVTLGTTVFSAAGLGAGTTIGYGGIGVSAATNVVRAVRGNARVDKSYAKLGNTVHKNQRDGNKKVMKVLNKNGGIAKRKLKHSDVTAEDLVTHFSNIPLAVLETVD